ncbi:MAG: hypothetical protein ACRD6W_05000 [Nitrososphaerales archaeon]
MRNSQPEGIGRVASFGDLVAWNNLGRNIVFADRQLRPLAVFAATRFRDQDELSQYDLDIHAVLAVPGGDIVLALNHLGLVRTFRRSHLAGLGGCHEVYPVTTSSFVADVERAVVAGSRLVGSCPRSEGAIGLAVSEPLAAVVDDTLLGTDVIGEHLGEVTALGAFAGGDAPLVVAGGPGQVALVPVTGATVGSPRWRVDLSFRAAVIEWDGRHVWVAGPATASVVDDYEWDLLHGGGFVVLDPGDGAIVTAGSLPDDVAWGTGGVAVVRAGAVLCAVGRTGALHVLDMKTSSSWRSTPGLAPCSLGIAHVAVASDKVLYGFNRGGYRLWASPFGPPPTRR